MNKLPVHGKRSPFSFPTRWNQDFIFFVGPASSISSLDFRPKISIAMASLKRPKVRSELCCILDLLERWLHNCLFALKLIWGNAAAATQHQVGKALKKVDDCSQIFLLLVQHDDEQFALQIFWLTHLLLSYCFENLAQQYFCDLLLVNKMFFG